MIAHFLIHSQLELSYFINDFQRVSFRRTVPLPQDAQPLDTVHSDLRPPRCPVRRIASPSTKYDAPSSSPLLRLARTQDKMPPFRVRTEQGTIRVKEVKLSKKGDTPTPNGPCADTRRNPTFPVSYWGGGGDKISKRSPKRTALCAYTLPSARHCHHRLHATPPTFASGWYCITLTPRCAIPNRPSAHNFLHRRGT